jgi:hypothetical protein
MKDNGGIDLRAQHMDLRLKNAGNAIKFHIDPAQLAELQNAAGFVPVNIHFEPLPDLRRFLGITAP